MGMKIFGVLAAQNKDNAGEVIDIAGLDDTKLGPLIDEHPDDIDFFHTLGAVTFHKKIMSEKDCETDHQRIAWRRVQVPLLYIEGELCNDEGHPNAESAAALIRFCSRPEVPLKVGLSVDGGVLERLDPNGQPTENKEVGKYLKRSVALRGALTHKPCNPKCFLEPMDNLQKSDWVGEPPAAYWEALKKSQAKSSIIQSNDFLLYVKLEKLKKSLQDYFGGFTSMRCKKCGHGVRFFKSSSKELPNGCTKCGTYYAISDLWSALNKTGA